MISPKLPENESERQKAVEKYQLLDSLSKESFDSITAIMAHLCEVPISLITLLDKDRNFLVSHHGVPFNEDPRDRSFCGHAILEEVDIMIIPDASKDERFIGNPLVTEMGVRFYAGAPLVNANGFKLGTLCVFDTKPKELTPEQIMALKNMSKQVMIVMESHFQNRMLLQTKAELVRKNVELKKFAAAVSHDLKSPIASIYSLTAIIEHAIEDKVDAEVMEWVKMIQTSSLSLTKYIDGVLKFYHSDELVLSNKVNLNLAEFKSQLESMFATEKDLIIELESDLTLIKVNEGAFWQIMINLVTNGIKYNAKEIRNITIRISAEKEIYSFQVSDNGEGIENKKDIFTLFETNNKLDRHGNKGLGIGLPSVKQLIEKMNGEISFESTLKVGTTFNFTLPY